MKRNPEVPPAGAPAGFDYAAVLRCYVRPFALFRRSAQDDTVGYFERGMYIFCPSWIVGTDLPLNIGDPACWRPFGVRLGTEGALL